MRKNSKLATLITLTLGMAAATGCNTTSHIDLQQAAFLMDKAELRLNTGRTDSAMAAFGMALEANPKLTSAYMGMGDIYRQWGNTELARRRYETATETNPNSFDAQYWYGRMTQKQGKVKDSISIYLRALEIDQNHAETHGRVAGLYLSEQKSGSALNHAQRATDLNPDDMVSWYALAICHKDAKQYDKAIGAYKQAAQGTINKEMLKGWYESHAALKNHDKAVNVLKELVKRYPDAHAYERIGYHYFKLQNYELALDFFNKATVLDGNLTAALNGVGVSSMALYETTGKTERQLMTNALKSWKKSLAIDPNQAMVKKLYNRFKK